MGDREVVVSVCSFIGGLWGVGVNGGVESWVNSTVCTKVLGVMGEYCRVEGCVGGLCVGVGQG